MTPTLKTKIINLSGFIAAVSAIIGGTITVENRYAKAEDIKQLRIEQQAVAQKIQSEQKRTVNDLRKQQLEDKLFELRLRPAPTIAEKALMQRYQQQLEEIIQKQKQLEN